MASYWKSPYKERTHSDALHAAFAGTDPLVPVTSQSYRGLNKAKQGGHISPQDWFDWAFVVNNTNIRPYAANFRHPRAELKGILKLPPDESSIDDGKTGMDTESNESSRSEFRFSRKEKKKVTFDESFGSDVPSNIRFQPSLYTEPMNSKTRAINLKNSFPPKKTSGLSKLRRLPSVSAEGVLNQQEAKVESNTSGSKCKHNHELRCANCVSNADPEKTKLDLSTEQASMVSTAKEDNLALRDSQATNAVTPVPVSGFTISGSKPGKRSAHSTQTLQLNSGNDKTSELPREPLKKYKPQWVKTITPLQRKRQYLRQATRQNGRPTQTKDISKTKERYKLGFVNSELKNQVSEDFAKLQISGDGKLVSTKLDYENKALELRQNSYRHLKTSNSRLLASNPLGVKTRPSGGSLPQCPPLARGGSAPGRLREDRDSGQTDYCLDKTSQILSWLDDVRSKSHFKSRTSRIYASGPTDSVLLI